MATVDNEFRLAVGAAVGYCLYGETQERAGTVVEVDAAFVTVRDRVNRNEVRVGKADSIRVLDVGDGDVGETTGQARGMQRNGSAVASKPAVLRTGLNDGVPLVTKPITKAHTCKVCGCSLKDGNVRRQLCDVCKQARKMEMQRVWRAKQGKGGGRPKKVCPDCHKPFQATGNSQVYCAACGAIRLKARESKYRRAAAAKSGRPSRVRKPQGKPAGTAPRVKPVAARAKTSALTVAAQDNPRGRGMVIVPRPLAPKHAPSTADVTPGTPRGAVTVDSQDVFRGLLVQQAERYERLAAGCRELAAAV